MVELLLDEGSDPGFGELMSDITPFQRIHIINNSRRTKNMYSTRLILKMLKSPSSLDFSKKQGRKNLHVRPQNTFSSQICSLLIAQPTHLQYSRHGSVLFTVGETSNLHSNLKVLMVQKSDNLHESYWKMINT
jgi:hypothetical protein